MEKAGITVVPVLRPVTDCRPSERLGLNQTGILGGRETSRTPRPPGKKGVGRARRSPTRIRHRPSPPTSRVWFPRLRSPYPFRDSRALPPTFAWPLRQGILPGTGVPCAPSRSHRSASSARFSVSPPRARSPYPLCDPSPR